MSTGFGSGYAGVRDYDSRRAWLNRPRCGAPHTDYVANCTLSVDHEGGHLYSTPDVEEKIRRGTRSRDTDEYPEEREDMLRTISGRLAEKYRLSVSIDQSWQDVVADVLAWRRDIEG